MTSCRRKRSARGSGDKLRAEILVVTRRLLAESANADAVSIRAIAAAVGVSAPSIYRHFADKDVLIEAVCAQVLTELDEAMRVSAPAVESPLERLRLSCHAYVRFARQNPEHYRIAMMQIHDDATELDRVVSLGAFQWHLHLVAELVTAGLAPAGDPLPIALETWAIGHGIASLLISKPFLPWGDVEATVDRLIRASAIGYAVLATGDVPQEVREWILG